MNILPHGRRLTMNGGWNIAAAVVVCIVAALAPRLALSSEELPQTLAIVNGLPVHDAFAHSEPAEGTRSAPSRNIKWSARLGSVTNGTPAIAGGKVFIGTNNAGGYLARYPAEVDLGVLLCFDGETGRFLWQYSCEKLPTGKVHDWPLMGICATPLVEGDRLWLVTNRGEVVCLDTEGFLDGENDGPFRAEDVVAPDEADVVWRFDMMAELGVRQHNMANCSVTAAGDVLFVCTSNGVDRTHERVDAPHAPSFIALDRHTGRLLWSDNTPGENILHGQWSSPAYGVLGGAEQVIFAGGDGWLYSFAPRGDGQGNSLLYWKFDCNLKTSVWGLDGRCERNEIIAMPVLHEGRVYVATGQSPDRGGGPGRLWCIRPPGLAGGADVSAELAFGPEGDPLPPRRGRAVDIELGEFVRPNPKSAAQWCYTGCDVNGDGRLDFHEMLHRMIGTPVVHQGLLVAADFSGVVHCIDVQTGTACWTCDLMESVWASPLVVEDKIYVADEGGTVSIFSLARDPEQAMTRRDGQWAPRWQVDMREPIHATPIVAGDVLYIATQSRLYAIRQDSN